MIKIPQTLLDELVRQNIISRDDLKKVIDQAEEESKEIGKVLIEREIISDKELLKLKSSLYRLPAVDLEGVEVDRSILKEVSEDVITFYHAIPFSKENGVLRVGILNPEDIGSLEALKFIGEDKKVNIEKYVITYRDFDNLVKSYRTLTGEVGEAIESFTDEIEDKQSPVRSIEEITAEAPVTRIVAVIVKHAVESRASDIHIEPFEDRVRTRFRIDGVLVTSLTLPKNLQSAIVTRIKILTDLKIDETRLAQDGRFSTKINGRKVDFRVSTFPTKSGEKVVMRILDPLTSKIDLPDLGLVGRSAETIEKAMAKPFGAILITGPTGSGKSTTLAGMLKKMNSEDINIVTLEDPIEYFVDGVNQSQVHEEIG